MQNRNGVIGNGSLQRLVPNGFVAIEQIEGLRGVKSQGGNWDRVTAETRFKFLSYDGAILDLIES